MLKNCYRLISNGTWVPFYSLNTARSSLSMIEVGNLLLSIGGALGDGNGYDDTFEFIDVVNGKFWIESRLPFKVHSPPDPPKPCSTKINQTTILIIGGIKYEYECGVSKMTQN